MTQYQRKEESMKKQTSNKKSGNEQVKVSTRIDGGKTNIEIKVYAPAGRATRKEAPIPETSKASS